MAIDLKVDPQIDDETLVELNEDQIAVIKKESGEIYHLLNHLVDLIERNSLTKSSRYTATSLLESLAGRIVGAAGEEGDIKSQQEIRFAEIREKNIEIRRLEDLLGSKRGVDGVAESLSLCKKNFHNYWNQIGFSLVYDHPWHDRNTGGFVAGHGNLRYLASLSTMLNDRTYSFSDTPVSDKTKRVRFLEEINKVLDLAGKGRNTTDLSVLDTQKNREYITSKLQEQYPSLKVMGWRIRRMFHGEDDEERMQIRSLEIEIDNVNEMLEPVESVYDD